MTGAAFKNTEILKLYVLSFFFFLLFHLKETILFVEKLPNTQRTREHKGLQ